MLMTDYKKLSHILLLTCVFAFSHAKHTLAQTFEKRGVTARDLAAIRDIKAMSVSPDGQYIAYQLSHPDIESNSYVFSWYVARTSPQDGMKSEPKFIADGGDLIFGLRGVAGGGVNGEFSASPPSWSPDGKRFAYTLKKDGQIQIWLSHAQNTGQRQITNNEADVRYFTWSDDGKSLLYSVGRSRKQKSQLDRKGRDNGYLVKADIFATSIDMPAPPPCRADRASDMAAAMGITDDEETCFVTIWKYDFETRQERLAGRKEVKEFEKLTARDKEERERYALSGEARFMLTASSDGKRAAWVENVDPGVYLGPTPPRRVAVTTDKGATVVCELAECVSRRFSELWWSADAAELYFMARSGAKASLTSLRRWTPDSGEVHTILETDDQLSDCYFLQTRIVCKHESWTSPNKIVSIDLTSGAQTVLEDPNPAFRNFRFTKIEKLVWTDAAGNVALGHLAYPEDYQEGRAYPLVVTTYRSRGFLRGAVGDEQPIHVFAQNGFFVLSYDVPEDDENTLKEGDFIKRTKAGFGYQLLERGSLKALEVVLDRLEDRGLIDPERIGMTAFSFGANLLQVALVHSDRFSAASTAWLDDAQSIRHFRPSGALQLARAVFGDDFYDEDAEVWRQISVSVNADNIDVPLLMQVADREYFGTLPTFIALKDANKPVEMYRFHNEYHVKWQPAHRYAVYNRNIDWFNFWLRGVEDPTPEKAPQYERWRVMREIHCTNMMADGKEQRPVYCQ